MRSTGEPRVSGEAPAGTSPPEDRVELSQDHYIRHKLYGGDRSTLQRYADLVVGQASAWQLIRYELLTTLLGPIPGGLGLALRQLFYPSLFRRVGKGVVFGRGIVLRHANRIDLGDRVLIDDDCVLDARGAGEQGVRIGDEVVINRGAAIQAKVGPIQIGSACDVGSHVAVVSQGGVHIDRMVAIGGGCKIGGGSIDLAPEGAEDANDPHDFDARGQRRFTRGAVRIGEKTVFGMNALVLDGASIGARCVVGTGAVVRESVPDDRVVLPHTRVHVVPRAQFAGPAQSAARPSAPAPSRDTPPQAAPAARERSRVAPLIFRALDELNEQLPPEKRVARELEGPLMQPDGPLDSLGLMNLVAITEELIEQETGSSVALADGAGTEDAAAPFATLGTLIHHVERRLEAAA